MRFHGRRACAAVLLSCFALNGCTALRQLRPQEMAAGTERRDVRVETLDGRGFEFDVVRFGADSLTGFRRLDTPLDYAEYRSQALAFGDVQRIAVRRIDWYRTGLIALGLAVGAVTIVIAQTRSDDGAAGGGGPIKPPPDAPN